jgi:hypothetical protein
VHNLSHGTVRSVRAMGTSCHVSMRERPRIPAGCGKPMSAPETQSISSSCVRLRWPSAMLGAAADKFHCVEFVQQPSARRSNNSEYFPLLGALPMGRLQQPGVVTQKAHFQKAMGSLDEFFWSCVGSRSGSSEKLRAAQQIRPLKPEGDYSYAMREDEPALLQRCESSLQQSRRIQVTYGTFCLASSSRMASIPHAAECSH